MRQLMFLDVESKGVVNLPKAGAHKYWADPHTSVTMLVYFFNDDMEPRHWLAGAPPPAEVAWHLRSIGFVVAHNAEFEYLALQSMGFPWSSITPERMICTAAQCRASGLPGSLDRASRCLELTDNKDMSGHRLMMKLCRPAVEYKGGTPIWHVPTQDETQQMLEYCERDTLLCAQLYMSLPKLTKFQQDIYLASFEINQRGIPIDVEFAKMAVAFGEKAREETGAALSKLTGGDITSVGQVQRIKEWINEDLAPEHKLDSISEATLLELSPDEITNPTSWEIIQLRLYGRAAAVGKYAAMVAGAQIDNRLRGAFMPFGAPTTGRFSSQRVQVHNLRRDALDVDAIKKRAAVWDPTLTLADISRCVRGTIKAKKGYTLIAADWAQIEARVLPWLCRNSHGADAVLNVFRAGEDLYAEQARKMFGLRKGAAVNKEMRFQGKVATLALGYQGGWRALDAMAVNNGAKPFGEKRGRELVDLWRASNQWAVALWRGIEDAAVSAVVEPGAVFEYGRVRYVKPVGGVFLLCVLPSGRELAYPFPEIEYGWGGQPRINYKKAARPPKKGETDWPRTSLYGGIQTENIAQAVAFDVLAETLIMCYRFDIPVTLHVHDEPVIEVPTSEVEDFTELLRSIMTTPPVWAPNLPLAVDVETMQRFK